jgi:hypothetical protein
VIVKDAETNASLVSTINLTTKPAAPSSPDLAAGSDLGTSSTDNQTADDTPTIDLTGLVTGAVVTVTATPSSGSPVTCAFTATSSSGSCTFSTALGNGTYAFKASQTLSGLTSADSSNLSNVVINKTTLTPSVTLDLVDADDLGSRRPLCPGLRMALGSQETCFGVPRDFFGVPGDGFGVLCLVLEALHGPPKPKQFLGP